MPELQLGGTSVPADAPLNAAESLIDVAVGRWGPDRPCVVSDGRTWSYGEVLALANQTANTLATEYGLVPGNRVLLRGENTVDLIVCWLGALKAGCVVVTTMPMLKARELDDIIRISQPTLILCDADAADELSRLSPHRATIASYGDDGIFDQARHRAGTSHQAVATNADDVALIAFTSGSTGVPKATMHYHRDVLIVADTFSRHVLRPLPTDLFTCTAPLAFTFGLGFSLIFPLAIGASILLQRRKSPADFARAAALAGATVVATAPTAYRAILAAGQARQLSQARLLVSGGEPLSGHLAERLHELTGHWVIDGFGSTELLHIVISCRPEDARPGTMGKAVPGYRVRVVDPDTWQEAPVGARGLLAVQGPTGCRYMADERQLTYVRDGWNVTGDICSRTADGYIQYHARSDDMIVSAGYNIAGPEIENALLRHADVVECAVVGSPDTHRGSVVKAFVVLGGHRKTDDAMARELQEHVKDQLAPYKYPRTIEFVPRLPRTSTGKIERFRLREPSGGH